MGLCGECGQGGYNTPGCSMCGFDNNSDCETYCNSDNSSYYSGEPDFSDEFVPNDYYFDYPSDIEEENFSKNNSTFCSVCNKNILKNSLFCGACTIITKRLEEKNINYKIRASFIPVFSYEEPILNIIFNHTLKIESIRFELPIIELLLKNGADPNISYKDKKILDLIIENFESYTLGKITATKNLHSQLVNMIELTKILLKYGAITSPWTKYAIIRIKNNLTFITSKLNFFQTNEFKTLLNKILKRIKQFNLKAVSNFTQQNEIFK